MSILISLVPAPSNKLQIYAHDNTGLSGSSWLVESISNIGTSWVKTFDVMNQQIRINLSNISGDACILNVDVYLMA